MASGLKPSWRPVLSRDQNLCTVLGFKQLATIHQKPMSTPPAHPIEETHVTKIIRFDPPRAFIGDENQFKTGRGLTDIHIFLYDVGV